MEFKPTREQVKALADCIEKDIMQGLCYDYATGVAMASYPDRIEITDNPLGYPIKGDSDSDMLVVLDSPFQRVKGELT